MDLSLNRVDYLQVGLTNPKTMKLLPGAGTVKSQQKVAVGDHDGVMQVFSMKKSGDPSHAFKTLPTPGLQITRVEMGGALGTVKDKIFASYSNPGGSGGGGGGVGSSGQNLVKGFTKKGKVFLDFDTNLTEPIKSVSITGSNLLVAGDHVYNQYLDCRDANYYLSEDRISDCLALPGEKVKHLTPVLACQDRTLRVMRDSSVIYKAQVPGPPSCLHLFYNDGGEEGEEVLFGTADGKIGLLRLTRQAPHTHWLIDPSSTASSSGSVKSGPSMGSVHDIDNYDITGDGVKDLIVGKSDGNIEVYAYDDGDDSEPILKYAHNCGESVTSVEGGVVGSTGGYDEILTATYTGWVFGMTTENAENSGAAMSKLRSSSLASTSTTASSIDQAGFNEKMQKLRNELELLQGKVSVEREKYRDAAQGPSPVVSAMPAIHINDQMKMSASDASYTLSLECQTPIDNVLLASDVPLDLLDVEKNSAVVSYSTCDPEDGNVLLATYRCQANTTRLEVKIRTIEGQYGKLLAYITPRLQPKCCQVREYKIKPLSLHIRTHSFDSARPHNTLKLTGAFSLAEMHTWLGFCLPEVPEKPPASSNEAKFDFVSCFLETSLRAEYSKGTATFMSDNISTISILKDFLTKEATRKRIPLDINIDVDDSSVIHTLQLLHPKLEAQLLLAKQVALIEPLKDLASNEMELMLAASQTSNAAMTSVVSSPPDTSSETTSASMFSPEYAYILENADALNAQFKRQPAHLERLYGMITDLYIDQHKFKGQNVKSRVTALLDILDKYSLQKLIDFFENA